MKNAKMIAGRLLSTIIVLLGVTLIAFLLVRLGGGDPARMIAGDMATPEEVELLRERMGLDQPYILQYFTYVKGLLQGDLGYSWNYQMPVTTIIANRLPQTAVQAVFALLIAVVIAIPLGMISGIKKGSAVDAFSMFFAIIGQSMSPVWMGLLAIMIFSVQLQWLPSQGMDGFKTWILPGIFLAFQFSAMMTRLMRSGMIDVLQEDYITATRARGIGKGKVYLKYAFKNALLPIITILGTSFGTMMAGSMVIENIFGWPGLGQLLVQAINVRDYALVQSILLISALIFVVCNLVADVVYTFVDPRISFN